MTGSIGGGLIARAKPRMATIEAKVTRRDGSVEDLGVVSYYHRNPLKRIWWRLKQIGRKR